MRILSFDGAFNVTPEERELRRMAKKYSISSAEVDRYKKMFDELDEDHSGRIENREFENLLYRCGNIPRDLGISASRRHSLWLLADPNLDGSIDFEEFLTFNLKYIAPGAQGLFGR
jgi:Ca2+-binding EF-hand superfamily protein